MSGPGRPYTRRRVLGLLGVGAAGLVAGRHILNPRTAESRPTPSAPPHVTTRRPEPTAPATAPTTTPPTTTNRPPPEPPVTVPYEPVEGEVLGDAKVVAARVVEALTAYGAGEPATAPIGRAMVHAAGVDPTAVLGRCAPLHHPAVASAGEVIYPQLGGLDPHSRPQRASVMVVVRQHLADERGLLEVSRCVDVRLHRIGDAWWWEDLGDASGEPVERPAWLPDVAGRALDHAQLHLPDSARWDVHEGIVDERVLTELVALADRVPLAVADFRRGHPEHVFGTDRPSAHMAGRAVDIWALGGVPVVQQQPDVSTLAHSVARELYETARISNLGTPWALTGAGHHAFTDPVHLDHLHLGVAAR